MVLTEEEEKEVMEEVDSPETGLQLQALFQRLLKRPVFATALCEENPSAEVRELSSHLQDALRERLRGAFLLKAWREKLEAKAAALPFEDPNASNLVAAVSCKAPRLLKSPLNPDVRWSDASCAAKKAALNRDATTTTRVSARTLPSCRRRLCAF